MSSYSLPVRRQSEVHLHGKHCGVLEWHQTSPQPSAAGAHLARYAILYRSCDVEYYSLDHGALRTPRPGRFAVWLHTITSASRDLRVSSLCSVDVILCLLSTQRCFHRSQPFLRYNSITYSIYRLSHNFPTSKSSDRSQVTSQPLNKLFYYLFSLRIRSCVQANVPIYLFEKLLDRFRYNYLYNVCDFIY